MRGWLLVLPLLATASVLAEAEDTLRAEVVDNSSDRIPLHTLAPIYPPKARRDRIEGQVQVCFEVDRRGRTRRIAVRNSTHRIFERPSIKAVRASTFQALADDDPLPAIKTCRTFIFSLEKVLPARPDAAMPQGRE
jgi:TonB family protein